MDSIVNVQKNNLSGGEKQKISIIRQLILNSPIMIFDEPTANLEPAIKKVFADVVNELKSDKIIIIVTHDRDIINEDDAVIQI